MKEAQLKYELAVCKDELGTKENLLNFAKFRHTVFEDQLKAKDDLLESKDEQLKSKDGQLKLSMELVASKDELAKAKQAPKGQPLACITNA